MWLSLSLSMEKQTNLAIKEIKRMSSRSDLSLLFNLCLYYINKNSSEPNQQEIEKISKEFNALIPASNDFCLFSSGFISWSFRDLQLASKFVNLIKNEEVSLSLKGWIALSRQEYKISLEYFDRLLSNHLKSNDLLALYGKAILLTEVGDFSNSIQIYAKISSHFDFPEIQYEKARIYISINKWPLAFDTISNEYLESTKESKESKPKDDTTKQIEKEKEIINKKRINMISQLEYHIIKLFNALLMDNDIVVAVQIMKNIESDIEKFESKNWKLCLELGKAILSVCHQTVEIIEHVIKIIEIASKESTKVLPFLAYCHAMKSDILNTNAVLGQVKEDDENIYSIEARLINLFETNRIPEVSDQLELYKKISNESIQLKTCEAKLFRLTNGTTGKNVHELCQIILYHIDDINTKKNRFIQFQNLKISSSKSELSFQNQEKTENSDENNNEKQSQDDDQLIDKNQLSDFSISNEEYKEQFRDRFAPMELNFERFMSYIGDLRIDSIISALDEMVLQNNSLVYFPSGQFGEKIELIFTKLFKTVPNLTPVRLHYALFLQLNKKYKESMEIIQSYLIRRWPFRLPLSFLIAAINEFNFGNVEESKQYIESTVKVAPIFNTYLDLIILKCRINHSLSDLPDFYDNLPILVLLKIIDLVIECEDCDKAKKYFQLAAKNAKNPKEKAQLVLRQAKILAYKKEYSKAFEILKNLSHHQKYLDDVVTTEAYIYHHFLKDDDNYMLCYEHLCEVDPTVSHFLMAGDAFCEIFEYDEAISFYESANKLANDSNTLEKLVMSLIKSHHFNLAISRYKMIGCIPLFLIKMLFKSKKFDKAKQYLDHSIRLIMPNQLLTIAPYIELRGDVHNVLHESNEAVEDYRSALKIYNSIFEKSLDNVFINKLKARASNLAKKIGDLTPVLEKVLSDYYLSLKYDPSNVDSFVAIFNFYKMRNDLKKCYELCIDFLSKSSESETVALLLTTIETRDFTSSINSLEKVLDSHPRFHRALVRLVEICARAGRLDVASSRLQKYEKRKDESPGFLFCKGLLNFYTGNNGEAQKYFMLSSQNRKWMLSTKLCIFNLLVNPNRKYVWCEKEPLSSQENINLASEILSSISNTLDEVETNLMTAELFIAHNTDESIHNALRLYYQVSDTSPNNIQGLTGIARCNLRLGNVKVTNIFIDKVFFSKPFHETYSYFEECYLMRASIISSEKDFRSSQQFIYLAIDLNLSSKKGWEMSGFVHMQNGMYNEAAIAFSKCWNLGDKKDKQIGYNFAYCSLKANRPDQALVVCRKLLDDNPDFTELLEKVMLPAFKMLKS